LGGWGPLKADRSPSPILHELLRIYPQAVAGELKNFQYDSEKKKFNMQFVSDTSIEAPTIISVPKELFPVFPKIKVTGSLNYETQIDSSSQSFLVSIKDNKATIHIDIQSE
jgi:hypothetical protein